MDYISVSQAAEKWGVSERSVRNYCQQGRIIGAVLNGHSWSIPGNAAKPDRKKRRGNIPDDLLSLLRLEKSSGMTGGIYHKIQIELTYNSNHIEGSRLSKDQTRYIFETNKITIADNAVNVDDIIETANHFRCVDLVIDQAKYALTESFIKQLHLTLKNGTSDSRKAWFATGDYKRLENEVGGIRTAKPEEVPQKMKELLKAYNQTNKKSLDELLQFHYDFERIQTFQDGNGRVGRLILFKECLRNDIVPFIIEDDIKEFYYRGLQEWKNEKGYLRDTCLTAQDRFRKYMDCFGIKCSE